MKIIMCTHMPILPRLEFFVLEGGVGKGGKVEHNNMVFINNLSDRTSRLGLIPKGTQSFLTRAIPSIILCVWGGGDIP